MIPKFGLIWSDNIELDDNIGWFGGGEINALFQLDFISGQYKLINQFEDDKIISDRNYSVCKLFNSKVFCFPVYGNRIWIYNLVKQNCSHINFENIEKPRFSEALIYNNRLYALTRGMGAIIEINPEKEEISNSIFVPRNLGILASNYIHNYNLIYCTFWNSRLLCEINIDTNEIYTYEIPFDMLGIATINLVEENEFWFTGFDRNIYIWNKFGNQKKILSLPKEIGFYKVVEEDKLSLDYSSVESNEAIFIKSIDIGENVWFIPFRSNEVIYVNKKTYHINVLEISDEEENYNSWNRKMNHKYLVEYVRQDRFIGLYSLKRKKIFEIDTVKFCVNVKSIILEQESINRIGKQIINEEEKFDENIAIHRMIFTQLSISQNKCLDQYLAVGKKVYKSLI